MSLAELHYVSIPSVTFVPPVLYDVQHPLSVVDEKLQDPSVVAVADADFMNLSVVLKLQKDFPSF